MKVIPFENYSFGCEIKDLGSFEAPTDSKRAEILDAFKKYKLILVRGGVELQTQKNLVGCIAPLSKEGDSKDEHSYVSTKPEEFINGDDELRFHSDYAWTHHGPVIVLSLYAEEMDQSIPTIFADGVAGAKSLPAGLHDKLQDMDLQIVASFADGSDGSYRQRVSHKDRYPEGSHRVAIHPAIDRHPLTGEEVLRVCQACTSNFVGMTEEASDPLFDEIEGYQYSKRSVYPHNWQVGDLVIWDNFALQHGRPPVEGGARRTLRRVIGNPIPAVEIMKDLKPDRNSKYFRYEVDRAET